MRNVPQKVVCLNTWSPVADSGEGIKPLGGGIFEEVFYQQ